MALDEATRERIERMVNTDDVVLFMKGTPEQPQCGFSASTAGILKRLVPEITTYNVLEDNTVREGIKEYANWPTIPQLYIKGEFMGGCDLVKEQYGSGELHSALGLDRPEPPTPQIAISDKAAETIRRAVDAQPGVTLHLAIDADWASHLNLAPTEPSDVKAEANGIEVFMDPDTAARADGVSIDLVETFEGTGFQIDNPNMPAH